MIYFYAKEEETHYDPITHEYLYVSDGITATNIGMIGYDATPGVFHNQSLFVKANDEVHGNEIFEYNLVDKTFKLYYDHNAGLLNSNPFLFNFKNQVYMVAENSNNGRELFKLQLPASSSAAIVERSANVDSEIDTKILEVYPNPATDKIYIKSNNDLSINSYKISTLQGRIVENSVKSSNPINEVNLSNLHTGMYILQITLSDNTTTTHKFYKN